MAESQCVINRADDLDKQFADLIICPKTNQSNLPGGKLSDLDYPTLVSCFEQQYRLWIFDFAELLVKGDNKYATVQCNEGQSLDDITINSGFAVLAVLNPYFDVIGKLCGDFLYYPYKNKAPSSKFLCMLWRVFNSVSLLRKYSKSGCILLGPEDFIKAGIALVFPQLNDLKDKERREILNKVYGRIRNTIAHSGLTGKRVILNLDYDAALVYGKYKGKIAVVINTHRWYECLHAHFEDYVSKLRIENPQDPEVKKLQNQFEERFPTLRGA